MPEPIGTIITEYEHANGIPGPKPDPSGANKTAKRIADPEVLYGYDVGETATERIGGDNRDSGYSGTGPRTTKSGRIDRRTREGRTGSTAETAPLSSDLTKVNLTDLLLSLHQMGAAFLSTPELELDKDEAAKLSEGIQKVGKYYAVALDPKKVAIAELAILMGGIYGTRYVAWRARTDKEEKREKITVMPAPKPSAAPPTNKPLSEMSPSELWPQNGVIQDVL